MVRGCTGHGRGWCVPWAHITGGTLSEKVLLEWKRHKGFPERQAWSWALKDVQKRGRHLRQVVQPVLRHRDGNKHSVFRNGQSKTKDLPCGEAGISKVASSQVYSLACPHL